MTTYQVGEAVPPPYAEYIGRHALRVLGQRPGTGVGAVPQARRRGVGDVRAE